MSSKGVEFAISVAEVTVQRGAPCIWRTGHSWRRVHINNWNWIVRLCSQHLALRPQLTLMSPIVAENCFRGNELSVERFSVA
jgi:hypothetical protein